MRRFAVAAASIAAMACFFILPASAQSRLALVIANSAYQGAPPIASASADANLVAVTLQAAGYDVTQYADLTKDTIGAAFGPFIEKIKAAGPNAVVFVYFSGYAAQSNADNYLIPVDVQIATADTVPDATLPLLSVIKALSDVPSAARIIVLDAARDGGFGAAGGQPVPPGLALIGAPPGVLVAYSAAPGTYAPDVQGANSLFANALATLMRQPGLDIEQIFKGVRLQVNQATNGTQTPWMTSALNVEVKLFDAPAAAAAAPKTLVPSLGVAGIAVPPATRRRVTKVAMRRMPADEAYRVAIEEDSLPDYQWFVESHPDYSLAGQIWDIITNRREGILWRRTLAKGTTRAYWNYLDRYPNGGHSEEARRWLDFRGAPMPSDYVAVPEELPPGYYDEAIGLPDLVPEGFGPPARVFFGGSGPEFVPAPRPWRDRPVTININLPPPPPQHLNNNLPLLKPKPKTDIVQPVPTILQGQATAEQNKLMADLQKRLAAEGKKPAKPIAPLVSADQLQKEVQKQLDAQIKKEKEKAAAAEAAAKKDLGPPEKVVLLPKEPNQPNRWQELLKKKEAERKAAATLTPNSPSKPIVQGKVDIVD